MGSTEMLIAAGPADPGGWLATWLVLAVIVVTALVLEGLPPLLLAAVVALTVGLMVLLRGGNRVGILLIAAADLTFLVMAAPRLLRAIAEPISGLEYVTSGVFLVTGIGVLLALRASWGRDVSAHPLLPLAAVTVLTLAIMFSGVTRLTSEDVAPRRADYLLTADDAWFSQLEVTLRAGELTIEVENLDARVHGFVIEKLDIDETLPGNTSRLITFTAPPGIYRYFCDIPGHDLMRGKLTLLESY